MDVNIEGSSYEGVIQDTAKGIYNASGNVSRTFTYANIFVNANPTGERQRHAFASRERKRGVLGRFSITTLSPDKLRASSHLTSKPQPYHLKLSDRSIA